MHTQPLFREDINLIGISMMEIVYPAVQGNAIKLRKNDLKWNADDTDNPVIGSRDGQLHQFQRGLVFVKATAFV